VEHGGGADAGTQVLRIGGDGEHRFGRRAEQQVVDHCLVLVSDLCNLGRQGEDEVEIADRQEIGLARGKPVLRHCPKCQPLAQAGSLSSSRPTWATTPG